jgi:hypothetical protein
MEITKIFSCGEELVETPLYAIEIESQVKSVPTGEWRRQKIFHDRKYRGSNSEFGIRNSEFLLTTDLDAGCRMPDAPNP